MKPVHELFDELLERGCCYRYDPERFAELNGGGQPFPSPTRMVDTPSGPMIEELVQPTLNQRTLTSVEEFTLHRLAVAWPTLMRAQMKIFEYAHSGFLSESEVKLIQSLCTPAEWEHGRVYPGYSTIQPFIRLDAVKTDEGFKIIDVNSTRPAGVGDLAVYTSVMGDAGSTCSPFHIGRAFAQVVRTSVDQWASAKHLSGESIPVEVVVRHTDGDWQNFNNLTCQLKRAGMSARIIDPEDLKLGEPSAIVRGRIKEGDPAYAVLREGYPDRRCVMSPLHRRFLGNKVWMYLLRVEPFATVFHEMLGDMYTLFTQVFAEIGIVDGETVRFADRTPPLSELQRQDWVIKDPASSSGRRMYLGYQMGKAKWAAALNEAKTGWIVQRFYHATEDCVVAGPSGDPQQEKLFTKYGIYIFRNQLAGIELHSRRHPVVHGARNTYMNAVYRQLSTIPCLHKEPRGV